MDGLYGLVYKYQNFSRGKIGSSRWSHTKSAVRTMRRMRSSVRADRLFQFRRQVAANSWIITSMRWRLRISKGYSDAQPLWLTDAIVQKPVQAVQPRLHLSIQPLVEARAQAVDGFLGCRLHLLELLSTGRASTGHVRR